MYYSSGEITLTHDQKAEIRGSWALITPMRETTAHLFYYHLFQNYPELKPMFVGNMKVQGERFFKLIDLGVQRLDQLETFAAQLKDAGKAHRDYGVALNDYKKVKVSLLWTLEASLGEQYSMETREAWAVCYNLMSFAMIEGAEYGTLKTELEPYSANWLEELTTRST